MANKTSKSAGDPTEEERRKNLSESEVHELELAGGVEGGMKAGSAGGPSGSDRKQESKPSNPPSQPGPQRPGR
jgi:hypothetical protein